MGTKRFFRRMIRPFCWIVAVALLPWPTARAADVTVTTTSDAHAATTRTIDVDDVPDDFPVLGCSLREAIDVANAGLTGTVINGCTVIQSGAGPPIAYHIELPNPKGGYTYTLTGAAGEDSNAGGDLDVTANVIISGWGAGTTIIDGGGIDRVFDICPGGSCDNSVTIADVTIRNGDTTESGGGIHNYDSTVTVQGTIITGNMADSGGGIVSAYGTMTVTGSIISDNWSDRNGGGISSGAGLMGGTMTVQDTTISGNTANHHGGGIMNAHGTMTVTGTTVISNSATSWNGGGIDNSGTAVVTGSRILNNTATGDGGSVFNREDTKGATSVTGSCIIGNSDTAFFNDEVAIQTATGNWWGATSGPSGAGPGSGDSTAPRTSTCRLS
jgi:CSLREA domain-containing protein